MLFLTKLLIYIYPPWFLHMNFGSYAFFNQIAMRPTRPGLGFFLALAESLLLGYIMWVVLDQLLTFLYILREN